jgi:hypothetical protein
MTGMSFTPRGFGGTRRNPDQVKRDGWKPQLRDISRTEHLRLSG